MVMNYEQSMDTLLIAALAARSKGGSVSPEQIQAAVEEYMQSHPPGELEIVGTTLQMSEGGN